jgi:multidrug efflux pump subunit AcrB
MKLTVNEVFKRKYLVIFLFLILLGYGIYSYVVIPKQEMPDISTPYMTIFYTVPGVSSTEIDSSVIKDTEKLILTYEDVTEVRSTVYDNFAYSTIIFSFSTKDTTATSEDIFAKINALSLNENITDISYNSEYDDPHIIYTVHSNTLADLELNRQTELFKNELLMIDEIKDIEITTSYTEEVNITLNTAMLELYQLSITDVYNIIFYNNLNIPLGGINTSEGFISISSYEALEDLKTLEDMIIIPPIPTVSPALYLKDISTISLQDSSLKQFQYDNENTTFVSVYFKDDIDFTKMTDIMNTTKKTFLENSSVEIDELLFLPDYVNEQITNVFTSLLIAIVVVMIVVLLGIGFRNSLLIIITIPVIVFSTIALLNLFGYELHKLTIVGLIVAIGIMVDNSIVITESIKRHLEKGDTKIESAKKAVVNNFAPVLSSTLTTIAAFIVIVLLPGFLGEVVRSMPLTVIITISLSFIVSMTLSPVLAMFFLQPQKHKKKKKNMHEARIKKMIQKTIKFPIVWISISFVLLFVSGYFAYSNLPLDLYPNDERSILFIDYENNTLYDLQSTELINAQIIELLEEEDRVLNYASSIGGDLPQFHFSAAPITELPQYGRVFVNLDMTEAQLLDYVVILEAELQAIDSAKISVNTIELSPPIAPLRVTLSSDSISRVDTVSGPLFDKIIALDTVKTYQTTINTTGPKYNMTYNTDMIASSFVTKAQIDSTITLYLNGYDIPIYKYNDQIINISLNADVVDINDILSLTVHSELLDSDIPLSTFITITEIRDYTVINRYNNMFVSYIDLYYTNDSDLKALEQSVFDIVDKEDTTNITITYGGENEMFTEISGDLISASILAIVLIFIIMFVQFNHFLKPLIVLLTIPLSFTGSFLFLLLFNSPITATALIGMVSLLGVTVNTGILLVEYISRELEKGHDIVTACTNAVYLRFRPIILTSLTTILGLIPLLISGGNFFRPLAITFMGGMVSSTIMTLFVIPSAYKLIHRKNKVTT